MSHPAVTRLRQLLAPPGSGGDAVDWDEVERSSGLVLPADYREFVEVYGGGEIDEYLSVSTPPVPGSPYGDLLERKDPALPEQDRERICAVLRRDVLPPLLPFADTASGDVAFWVREGEPDGWRVLVFRRQTPYGTDRWTLFDRGMADFCGAALTGEVNPFSERLPVGDRQHEFAGWRGAA
ncbi:SMI1/KNR4 family protein [Streptomyces sp. NPDC089424]|uniref:SMI1/KNR4 family protein n=1 Tax=Streptomyces sp. NPDC089424 TaxID=3365917 RepID=UPI0038159FB5